MVLLYIYLVPSGAPLNVSATGVVSMNFTLTWNPPAPSERNGIITGYNISITSLDSFFEDPREFFTTSEFLIVDSLDPHSHYVCIIAANTFVGIGPFSLEVTIRTAQYGDCVMHGYCIYFDITVLSYLFPSTWCSSK